MNTSQTLEKKAAVKNGVSRLIFAGIAIVLEITLILLVVLRLNEHAEWIAIGTRVLGALLVLGIYSKDQTSSIKMTWIILIMALPILGVTLYLFIGLAGSTRKMSRRYEEIDRRLLPLLPKHEAAAAALAEKSSHAAGIANYLYRNSGYPLYQNSAIEYYDDAAKGLAAQKEALKRAKKFIFMEYHAIEDAESWHGLQEILEQKAHEGLDVRVFYDDIGSIGFINTDFVKRLEARGIRCRVFNPFGPGLNLFLNNRDHRKITVIDGTVGFTGGYNLANEYFNITHPYGHWKDTGVKLSGEAVRSLTVTFLEMWNAVSEGDADDRDFSAFLPDVPAPENADGFIQPYADSPMDDEHVGEEVYISMAEGARSYVWYITPYLILTDEMTHALTLAAKRGVDVRVITPGIPDKKMIYSITRSYYHALVRSGVRIFEYTPGFCHCKMSVCDDEIATCGTINMDYRSLYHHFENGCLYACTTAVADTKRDFEQTMAQSCEVTDDYRAPGAGLRLKQLILRLLAPLM